MNGPIGVRPLPQILRQSARDFVVLLCLALLSLTALPNESKGNTDPQRSGAGIRSAQTDAPKEIELKKPLQRDLGGNEVHSYRVLLRAAQFASINVQQSPIDVSISIFDPQGQLISKQDQTTSGETETVSLLSEVATTYRIDLKASDPNGPKGSYTLTMDELRPSSTRDKPLVAAERLASEGMKLLDERTEESRRGAVEKYEQARALSQSVNDQAGQAWSLYMIAYIRVQLGEAPKAIE